MTKIDEFLTALDAEPRVAIRYLCGALAADDARELRAALRSDQRFGPLLQAICRDVEALEDAPWLAQFLGALKFAPAIPELQAVWRANRSGPSSQAGRALLAIGDSEAVRAMADDLPSVKSEQIGVALEAVFSLSPTEAYERLAPLLDLSKPRAANVLGMLTSEQLAVEPRWVALAVRAVREGDRFCRESAACTLQRTLLPAELADLFPDAKPPQMTAEQEAAYAQQLDNAREKMVKLRDGLAEDVWQAPKKSRKRHLARLEETLGPLPAFVRAFYELMDGITVPARRGKKPFVVYPLDNAIAEAKAWKKAGPSTLVPPFIFPIAPDAYTLAGYSGGPDVGFEMPCDDPDPRLMNMSRPPRFGAFVRRALKACG